MLKIRRIQKEDDASLASLIRRILKAHHLDIPGTVYFDEGLDHLSEYYLASDDRDYFVVVNDDNDVIGGAGLAPFEGFEKCAELQKLYLEDKVRGKGIGYRLLQLVEQRAAELGYGKLYLETHTNLDRAIVIYEKYGFEKIEKPESVSHSTMNCFYIMDCKR